MALNRIFQKLCFAGLILLLFSCNFTPAPKTDSTPKGFSRVYGKGQLALAQWTTAKEITIAEQLVLVLEISAPENVEVTFPEFSVSLGDFNLKDVVRQSPRLTGSGDTILLVHRVVYELEPYLAGLYSIPAMKITARDRNNDQKIALLETEVLEINVKSLLPPDADRPEIKDIIPPLPLPPNRAQQFLAAGLLILLIMFAASGFFYWKKTARKKIPVEVHLRPDEIAIQELDRLAAENLLARGEIKLFHLRISGILRQYIENRFGLKAPERTTEEFLHELSQVNSSKDSLLGSNKTLVSDFLTQCDLVKFAKHEPTIAESEKTVLICREFIAKTREKDTYSQIMK